MTWYFIAFVQILDYQVREIFFVLRHKNQGAGVQSYFDGIGIKGYFRVFRLWVGGEGGFKS